MTSKIKVDNINKVSDDSNIINKCGTTVTVGAASDGVRTGADNLQAADGGNLISQSGTTITLGASGDTITLASGASQTGFGRTGTVDWQTSSIKTTTFTAANGEGYFANTSGGAFTMNLPAGTAGNIVSVVDYTNSFQTHNLTVTPNGSQKLGGNNASATLSTEGQSVTFVYVDDIEGWKNVQDSTSNVIGLVPFVVATGGTVSCSGNCRIHTFTGPGTFCVSAASTTPANNQASYMVVGGGAGGGSFQGGGGGAGGFREGRCNPVTPYTASPLVTCGHTLTAQAYSIVVGAGGATATSGAVSTFSTITSAGGGAGQSGVTGSGGGTPGGSGGGGNQGPGPGTSYPGGAGNTPPVSPPQGQPGGTGTGAGAPSSRGNSGGGGGAGGAGGSGSAAPAPGGGKAGGSGVTTEITASPVGRAGGGGGGAFGCGPAGGPASDGGGAGGPSSPPFAATAGTANTGGGGGGSGRDGVGSSTPAAAGGSGIVVIRYKKS